MQESQETYNPAKKEEIEITEFVEDCNLDNIAISETGTTRNNSVQLELSPVFEKV